MQAVILVINVLALFASVMCLVIGGRRGWRRSQLLVFLALIEVAFAAILANLSAIILGQLSGTAEMIRLMAIGVFLLGAASTLFRAYRQAQLDYQ